VLVSCIEIVAERVVQTPLADDWKFPCELVLNFLLLIYMSRGKLPT